MQVFMFYDSGENRWWLSFFLNRESNQECMFVSSELEKTSGKKFETASADGDCGISIKIARR